MRRADFCGPDNRVVTVEVIRSGQRNTRVVFPDGHEELVPTTSLADASSPSEADPRSSDECIVPTTPLKLLYRNLREIGGSKDERFRSIMKRIQDRHGPVGAPFIAELFARSQSHMKCFNNEHEAFYVAGSRPNRTSDHFANRFVELLSNGAPSLGDGVTVFEYVDYEINPLRTTRSCFETGKPATSSGAGGMDLLLRSGGSDPLPAVGEIKAKSEQVGPTFALLQALTYAVELVTPSQWARLGRHFKGHFSDICTTDTEPVIDVLVFLEAQIDVGDDLQFALTLAADILKDTRISDSIRRIEFLECHIDAEAVSINVVPVC